MKFNKLFAEIGRALVAGFCIAAVGLPQSSRGCAGSAGPACLLSPTPCLKTLSLGKSAPTGMGLVTFSPGKSGTSRTTAIPAGERRTTRVSTWSDGLKPLVLSRGLVYSGNGTNGPVAAETPGAVKGRSAPTG